MSNSKEPISIFWFRRDLRLKDNAGLFQALSERKIVQPIFIFDTDILSKIEDKTDARINFIYDSLVLLKKELNSLGSDLSIYLGRPQKIFAQIITEHKIDSVYANHDYEPYAIERDKSVHDLLKKNNIDFKTFKDHVLFEKSEVLNGEGRPYTVFTPYKKKHLSLLTADLLIKHNSEKMYQSFIKKKPGVFVELSEIGFKKSSIEMPPRIISKKILSTYDKTRDYPFLAQGTSHLGIHLRFGTLSVRELARIAKNINDTYLSELIWRDFFSQILWHFPNVVNSSFRPEYDDIKWRNDAIDFEKWKNGQTGYPLVDAGMRELNSTGHMHNRVRMLTASFLCKHLLIHWLKGERYFATKLLDYDLSSNNGNWQWAAGSGCDAAPYFRVFNPQIQQQKFDKNFEYIKKWVPEYGTDKYVKPMVDHEYARKRALLEYSRALKKDKL